MTTDEGVLTSSSYPPMDAERVRTVLGATLLYGGWLLLVYVAFLGRLAEFEPASIHQHRDFVLTWTIVPHILSFALGTLLLKRRWPIRTLPQLATATFCAAVFTFVFAFFAAFGLALIGNASLAAYRFLLPLLAVVPGLLAAQFLRFPRAATTTCA